MEKTESNNPRTRGFSFRTLRRAGLEGKPFEVCYNGGVLVHDEIVSKRLSLLLKERFSCTIRKKAEKAVYGALALAQELSEKE